MKKLILALLAVGSWSVSAQQYSVRTVDSESGIRSVRGELNCSTDRRICYPYVVIDFDRGDDLLISVGRYSRSSDSYSDARAVIFRTLRLFSHIQDGAPVILPASFDPSEIRRSTLGNRNPSVCGRASVIITLAERDRTEQWMQDLVNDEANIDQATLAERLVELSLNPDQYLVDWNPASCDEVRDSRTQRRRR